MNETQKVKPIRALIPAVILSVFHGCLWIALLGMMLWYVPPFRWIFEDFSIELPTMTKSVIGCSNVVGNYWYAFIPVVLIFGAADLMLLYVLYLRPRLAALRWVWLTLMFFAPLGLMAFTVVVMNISMITLTQVME